ncbi:MAG TPA: PilZ domain-containing protein [Gammaproteobacteria bacterium]|nr:PilZ domain-containing protein [Gammaproteobacteria bacterium]
MGVARMFEFEKIVGEKVALVSLAAGQRYKVEFIGRFKNNMLLVSLPLEENIRFKMKVGQCFLFRYQQGNVIYNYHTRIVRLCNAPYLCMQLVSAGSRADEMLVREPRLGLDKKSLKIALRDGNRQLSVSVVDISINGARLVSPVRLGQVNDVFHIDLSTQDGSTSICLPCKICYVRSEIASGSSAENGCYHHGIAFIHVSPRVENFLLRFAG